MIWVTWRQHRSEGLWALVLTSLLAAVIGFVAYQTSIATCPAGVIQPGRVTFDCLHDDVWGQLARSFTSINLYTYGLVVLPALAGAFLGGPLVAREIENGSAALAWTQGVTRVRWLAVKVILMLLPLLAAAAVVGTLYVALINAEGSQANRWAFFDQQAPMTAASTAFAVALGIAAGSVIRKSIPAIAATLVGFVVIRIGIAELARPHYMSPRVLTTSDVNAVSTVPGTQTAWWLDQFPIHSDVVQQFHYQPGDRFWAFQTIESGILVALAAVLIAFTFYWVSRRLR